MINTYLVGADGSLSSGGQEQIALWQQQPQSIIWVDIHQAEPADEDEVLALFGVHPLVIADARRHRHPPKLEVFDDSLFILLRGLDAQSRDLDFGTIQLALFAGERFLITRHDKQSVSVNHWANSPQLAEVLAQGGVRLALDISKTVANRYLELLLNFEPRLAELEEQLEVTPDDSTMRELTGYRTRLRKMRRDFNYHHRLFDAMREEEVGFFQGGSVQADSIQGGSGQYKHIVTDVYEKYERLLSLCTLYYEQAGDLVEGYISLSSHELNNTMRILTVLTAIFVPLGFLAGLYGMNFDHMPELHVQWGYYGLLSVMATIIVALLALFKYKRWL